MDELKGAGLLEGASAALSIPDPRDPLDLADDEDPLADDDPGTDII